MDFPQPSVRFSENKKYYDQYGGVANGEFYQIYNAVAPAWDKLVDYAVPLFENLPGMPPKRVKHSTKPSAITTSGGFKTNMPTRRSKTTGRKPVNGKKKQRRIAAQNNRKAARFRASVRAMNERKRARSRSMRAMRGRSQSRMPRRPGGSTTTTIPLQTDTTFRLGARVSQFQRGPDFVDVPIACFDDIVNALYPTADNSNNFMVIGSDVKSCCTEYVISPRSPFYSPKNLRNTSLSWLDYRMSSWSLHFSPIFDKTKSGEIIVASIDDPTLLNNMGLIFQVSDNEVTNPRWQYVPWNGTTTAAVQTVISDYNGFTTDGVWGDQKSHYDAIRNWTGSHGFLKQPFDKWDYKAIISRGWKRNVTADYLFSAEPATFGEPPFINGQGPLSFEAAQAQPANSKRCIAGITCIWGTMADGYVPGFNYTFRKVGDLQLRCRVQYKNMAAGDFGDITNSSETGLAWAPIGFREKLAHDPQFIKEIADGLERLRVPSPVPSDRKVKVRDDYVKLDIERPVKPKSTSTKSEPSNR